MCSLNLIAGFYSIMRVVTHWQINLIPITAFDDQGSIDNLSILDYKYIKLEFNLINFYSLSSNISNIYFYLKSHACFTLLAPIAANGKRDPGSNAKTRQLIPGLKVKNLFAISFEKFLRLED